MANDFKALVSKWDELIRLGQGGLVVSQLEDLGVKNIPARYRPQVAGIARRVRLYKLGLDLLRDDYFASRNLPYTDLNTEILVAEYGALLTEIGATQISAKIFNRLEKPQYPFTYLYRALMWIKAWEHERAVSDLRAFRNLVSDEYWKAIADLNLTASLLFLRQFDESQNLIENMQARGKQLTPMVLGSVLELKGQHLFLNGRIDLARDLFAESLKTLSGAHNPSTLFAEKWNLICDLYEKAWPEIESKFNNFKIRMEEAGFWEIKRELDRFFALRFHDLALLSKLFFGSPAEGYRQMLCRETGWDPPKTYLHELAPGEMPWMLDLKSVTLGHGESETQKFSSLDSQFLRLLTSDLYKPIAVGSLFEGLYRDQFYDPANAAERVYQVIARFRKNSRKSGLPLEVHSTPLGFRLWSNRPLGLLYNLESRVKETPSSGSNLDLEHLRNLIGDAAFTAAELAKIQGISKRSCNRVLARHLQTGKILAIGSGRGLKYKIAS